MNESPIDADLAAIVSARPPQARMAGRSQTDLKAWQTIKLWTAVIAGLAFLFAARFSISGVCLDRGAQEGTAQRVSPAFNHGKQSFATRCATCHGLDGRGGEHAPDIVKSPAVQAQSDEKLARIIRNGIRDAGMPSFHFLTSQQIEELISYIHVLRGSRSAVNLKGNPSAGAKLFFGEARCSDCHMMHGEGGFIGSELSEFGRTHTATEIRQIILHPNKVLLSRGQLVRIVTHSGQEFSGLLRNEDNFSIALLSEDGVFHLLMKSEIARITREPRSIMPDDYGKKLTMNQVDDLVSYLILGAAHRSPGTNAAGASASK